MSRWEEFKAVFYPNSVAVVGAFRDREKEKNQG
jgi:acyl-CoA synthetase (NDP forming)